MSLSTTARAAAMLLLLASACSNTKGHTNIAVASARIEVVDGAGHVTQSVPVLVNNTNPVAITLNRNTPATLRVVWLNADGMPEPGAADAALTARFNIPPGYGLSYVPSNTEHYGGSLSGSIAGPEMIFVPFDLYHTTQNHAHFATLVPILVQ
jgi:hypothetical protein